MQEYWIRATSRFVTLCEFIVTAENERDALELAEAITPVIHEQHFLKVGRIDFDIVALEPHLQGLRDFYTALQRASASRVMKLITAPRHKPLDT